MGYFMSGAQLKMDIGISKIHVARNWIAFLTLLRGHPTPSQNNRKKRKKSQESSSNEQIK